MTEIKVKRTSTKSLVPNYATKEEILIEFEKIFKKNYYRIIGIINGLIRFFIGGDLINDFDAQDIVSTAVKKYIDDDLKENKKRKWDKANCPIFIACFINTCKSIFWNEYKKYCINHGINLKEKKQEARVMNEKFNETLNRDDFDMINDEGENDDNILINKNEKRYKFYDIYDNKISDKIMYAILQGTEQLSEVEYEEKTNELENKLKNELSDDPKALLVLEEILDGNRKDKYISDKHKIPIKEVRNIKKRIKRATIKVIKNHGG